MTLDCDCCAGGAYIVDFDYSTSGTYTYDDVWVWADSEHSMTLQKTNSNRIFYTTGTLELKGSGNNKAILDVDANGFDIDVLESCGKVDITGPTTTTVDILNTFQVGTSTCGEDTIVTIDGADINVAAGHNTVVVGSSSKKATLVLDTTALTVGNLFIGGRGSDATEAKYEHNYPSTHTGITGLTMGGHSWLDVNVEVDYGGDGQQGRPNPISLFTVQSNGYETVAKVDLDADSTLWTTNIDVTSSSDDNATLRPVSGTIKCNGTVTITGSVAGGSDAVLELPYSAAPDLDLKHVELGGRGVLYLEKDLTISGDLVLSADSDMGATPGAELRFDENVVLIADQIEVDEGVWFEGQFPSGAQVRNFTGP